MRIVKGLAMLSAGAILLGVWGCEGGGNDDDEGGTGTGTSETNETPTAQTFVDATVTLAAGGVYDSGKVVAPGEGIMSGRVTTTGTNALEAWFVKVADSSEHSKASGTNFSINVSTEEDEEWRFKVGNPGTNSAEAQIKVSYQP